MRYVVRDLYRKEEKNKRIAGFKDMYDAVRLAVSKFSDQRIPHDVVDTEDDSTVGGKVIFVVGYTDDLKEPVE